MTDLLRPNWDLVDNASTLPVGKTTNGDIVTFDTPQPFRFDASYLV